MAEKRVIEGESFPLREKCERIVQFGPPVSTLVEDLIHTMRVHHVLSLSAPQIGVPVQVAVIQVGQRIVELINPTMLEAEELQTGVEHCASFPDMALEVERPARIKVAAVDRMGAPVEVEASGLLARLIAHELDHLEGLLFYDQMDEDDLFLQVFESVTGGGVDLNEEEVYSPVRQEDISDSDLESAKQQEKTQIVDMIADAAWKLLLAVELLQDDDEVSDTPSMAHLRTLADNLRQAAEDWEIRLL